MDNDKKVKFYVHDWELKDLKPEDNIEPVKISEDVLTYTAKVKALVVRCRANKDYGSLIAIEAMLHEVLEDIKQEFK